MQIRLSVFFCIVRHARTQRRTPAPRGMASQHLRTFERYLQRTPYLQVLYLQRTPYLQVRYLHITSSILLLFVICAYFSLDHRKPITDLYNFLTNPCNFKIVKLSALAFNASLFLESANGFWELCPNRCGLRPYQH